MLQSEVQDMFSAEVIAVVDACVEFQGTSAEQRSIRESFFGGPRGKVTADLDQPGNAETGERKAGERALIHDSAHALQILSELQRYVERHSADHGKQCMQATDLLVNRIRRTPVHFDMKQAPLHSMLQESN